MDFINAFDLVRQMIHFDYDWCEFACVFACSIYIALTEYQGK